MKNNLMLLFGIAALLLAACDWDKTDPKPEEILVGVDLGLPSGVLWGSQNVGAYRSDKKGLEYEIGKALGDSDKGIVEKELGENWRLPTVWECRELIECCSWERSSKNRQAGYLVKSKVNSNSIFIPFNPDYEMDRGLLYGTEHYKDCSRYWTATLDDKGKPFYLELSERGQLTDSQQVLKGLIRPVIGNKVRPENIAAHSTAITLNPGDTARFVVDFSPKDSYDKYLEYASSNPSVAYINASGEVFALTPGQATIQATSACLGKTVECKVEVGAFIAPEKVDLGLPSGNLWSSFNLGARDNLSSGLFFKWGNVQPESDLPAYTGWINLGSTSSASQKTLSPEEDPATIYLGDKWHIPTADDFRELVENCSIKYEQGDKIAIHRLTSNINGNSILFLKGKGYLFFSNFEFYRPLIYWTSQDDGQNAKMAKSFGLDEKNAYSFTNIDQRNTLPIRPVWGERKD